MVHSPIKELEPLTKLLDKSEPRVVIVVGTGVSMGATSAPHASWFGLLQHGIRYLVQISSFTENYGKTLTKSLEEAFSPFDLKKALALAELVEQNLKHPDETVFAEWLKAAFGNKNFTPENTEVLDTLKELQDAGALLMTTNYDSLLSNNNQKLKPITWHEPDALLETINGRHSRVFHVHGHWEQPNSLVLGSSSYQKIVDDCKIQDALKVLWTTYSWVYVGCGDGLDDPNLGRLLEWGKSWGTASLPDYFLAKKK